MPQVQPSPARTFKRSFGGRQRTSDGHDEWLRGGSRFHAPEWCHVCLEISIEELVKKVAALVDATVIEREPFNDPMSSLDTMMTREEEDAMFYMYGDPSDPKNKEED